MPRKCVAITTIDICATHSIVNQRQRKREIAATLVFVVQVTETLMTE